AIANTCSSNADCSGGLCSDGMCTANHGSIDEALLEILPDATSSIGGLSFLSAQSQIAGGDLSRDIALPAVTSFIGPVQMTSTRIPAGCPYVVSAGSKQSIAARVEFTRISDVSGVPIYGIPNVPVQLDTTPISGSAGWNFRASLVPGWYEVYIQPVGSSG